MMAAILEEIEIDRSDWPEGQWDHEPDVWAEEWGEYLLLARRNATLGHWTGWLGLPPEHPWHGESWRATDPAIFWHEDGWHQSGADLNSLPGHWFIGFDCAHKGDRCPCDDPPEPGDEYRDLDFVMARLRKMAIRADSQAAHQEDPVCE